MRQVAIYVLVALGTVSGASMLYASCPPGCPSDLCPDIEAGAPLVANPSPANAKKFMCRQVENPAGSETWNAEQWANHLGLSVDPCDFDSRIDYWYIWSFCLCDLTELGPYDILGGPILEEWSGGPVDLTKNGQYTLSVRVYNPHDLEPIECEGGTGIVARWYPESVVVDFTITVGGVWVVSARLEDQSQNGALLVSHWVVWDLFTWPHTMAALKHGNELTPAHGDVETAVWQYSGRPAIHAEATVSTNGLGSVWRKVYEWQDGDGNPSNCTAAPTTFEYAVVVQAQGKAEGDASDNGQGSGAGDVDGSAVATLSVHLIGDDIVYDGGETSLTLTANGNAKQQPRGFTYSISLGGIEIGGDTSVQRWEFDSGLVMGQKNLTGSVKGGGDTKRVKLEIRITGQSRSELNARARGCESRAIINATPSFHPEGQPEGP